MRLLLKIAAVLLLVYGLFLAGLFAVMRQPPERLGRTMAKIPGPVFLVTPVRPMWNLARAGSLKAGDAAADFELPTVDKQSSVRLSSFRGRQPVVLVFGSYT
jgi:hypothetical protein